jgi:hypothetical protein
LRAAGLFETVNQEKLNMTERYQSVNGAWPEGTNDGRDIKPTPQEALAGAKRLYRIAMGRPFRGKIQLTSGRRYTYIRRGVFYVNPDQRTWKGGGGWHEIVHGISHYASARLYPNASGHGHQHAFTEKQLIECVVNKGWLDGKLKRPDKPKAKLDVKAVRYQRVLKRMERWEAKRKRAEQALKKLRRQKAYYENRIGA